MIMMFNDYDDDDPIRFDDYDDDPIKFNDYAVFFMMMMIIFYHDHNYFTLRYELNLWHIM